MAKAMEDTLFYRFNRLLAANEVGGEADMNPGGVGTFHALMQERARLQPHGLSATSTHDTKRGEDARARLYTLSEGADVWAQAVERWREMNREHLIELPGGLDAGAECRMDALSGACRHLAGRFLEWTGRSADRSASPLTRKRRSVKQNCAQAGTNRMPSTRQQ